MENAMDVLEEVNFGLFILEIFLFLLLGLIPIIGGIISFIYLISSIVPLTSLAVRRLHDTGKSGYYYFLVFIPIIGVLILFYFFCQDSEERQNQYGPSPKYIMPNNQIAPIFDNNPEVNSFNNPEQPYPLQPSDPTYIPPDIPPIQGIY